MENPKIDTARIRDFVGASLERADIISELKVICPFCNAQHTAKAWIYLSHGCNCESCQHGDPTVTLKIVCSNCGKIVYRKSGQ